MKPYPADILAKFWSYVEKSDGCWLWKGGQCGQPGNEYGHFNAPDRQWGAHRFAFVITYGPLPSDIEACHHCDNRLCVRPDHLFPGTQKQNMQDKARKGRAPKGANHPLVRHPERRARGERHGNTHLTPTQISLMRVFWKSGRYKQKDLAHLFRVTQPAVSDIVNYRRWQHLP